MFWMEQRLSELAEDGFFDDLPGSGKPIEDLDTAYSPTWWAARWVERDTAQQSSKAVRARLRRDVADALKLPRPKARTRLTEIAAGVRALNALLDTAEQLPAFDVDDVLIRGELP